MLYEAASIEDINIAYAQLRVDEDSLYSCIGIAGAQEDQEITVGTVIFEFSVPKCKSSFLFENQYDVESIVTFDV